MNKLVLCFFVCLIFFSNAIAGNWQIQQKQKARERAAYWAERGYSFNPDDITAWSMGQKVKDIERAKYWKERGYDFDPTYMTAWSMDEKVKDIERAKYWKKKRYNFNPNYMTAWAMDKAVAQSKNKQIGTTPNNALSPSSHSDSEFLFKFYQALKIQNPTKDDENEFSVVESGQEKFGSQQKRREN